MLETMSSHLFVPIIHVYVGIKIVVAGVYYVVFEIRQSVFRGDRRFGLRGIGLLNRESGNKAQLSISVVSKYDDWERRVDSRCK
jgi:hypothetical protein